jgi:branched-chain amino acid transport system ATP-binding protein
VGRGEVIALLGANGAGKTTTLRAILGLVPAEGGTVVFQGRSLEGLPPHRRVGLGVALVPEGRELFPGMSVAENLELGFPRDGGPGLTERLAFVHALFPVLADRRRQAAGTLSGGEQQMVAIARALMADPALLMLDEPSLGLAPRVVAMLYEKLAVLNEQGTTLLLVEQHVREALRLADRGYVLEGGRVVLEGSAADLRRDPYLRKTYLAV